MILYPDVSHYDWDRNKGNFTLPQDIVMIRASYGDPVTFSPATRYFREMATRAKSAGAFVGGYHNLVHGDDESINRQVAYFKAELDAVGADWAMLDIEPYEALKANNLYPRIEDAVRFAEIWSEVDGRPLAIYLAKWVWSSWLGKPDLIPLLKLAGGPLINANYPLGTQQGAYDELFVQAGGDYGPGFTSYGGVQPEVWQYTSNAITPGKNGVTDFNAFRGTVDDFRRKLSKEENVSAIDEILWPGFKAIEPSVRLGGIYANKPGYHNKRNNLPGSDYSVAQFAIDREGPSDEASAIDLTFPDAQAGKYGTISKYSKRLYAARLNNDPRAKYMREFFGQIDTDKTVEGWDFAKNKASSSDSSHLWHIHISIHRKYINSATAMHAILSILKGETVAQWQNAGKRNDIVFEHFTSDLPILQLNDDDVIIKDPPIAWVWRAQKSLGVPADGVYGPQTKAAVAALSTSNNGNSITLAEYTNMYAMWGATELRRRTVAGIKRTVTFIDFKGKLPILKLNDSDENGGIDGTGTAYVKRLQRILNTTDDGDYGPATAAAIKQLGIEGRTGNVVDMKVWEVVYALWGHTIVGTTTANRKENLAKK